MKIKLLIRYVTIQSTFWNWNLFGTKCRGKILSFNKTHLGTYDSKICLLLFKNKRFSYFQIFLSCRISFGSEPSKDTCIFGVKKSDLNNEWNEIKTNNRNSFH